MTLIRHLCGFSAALLCLSAAASAKPAKSRHHAPKHAPAKAHKKAAPTPAKEAAAPAAAAPGETILYDGQPAATAGVSLTAWGGGSVADSTDEAFAKTHSIKITTIDPYQGAKIVFDKPVALGDVTDKTRYLAFTLRQTSATSPAPPAQVDQNFGQPAFPGDESPGFDPSDVYIPVAPTPIHTIHLVLTLANGATADLMRPLPQTGDPQANIEQWINFAVPVSALGFSAADSASPLQSIMIAGDYYAVLYVGQIKLAHDTTPITCFAGDEQSAYTNQPLTLQSSASGGLSTLHYAWDFDTKGDAVEQASGPSVTTSYVKPGDYKVTLTVSDLDGIKKPAISTTVVHVQ